MSYQLNCEVCKRGVEEVSLHRVNEKGVPGIWRCQACLTHEQEAAQDPICRDIVNIIEQDNWSRRP